MGTKCSVIALVICAKRVFFCVPKKIEMEVFNYLWSSNDVRALLSAHSALLFLSRDSIVDA